jgi:hypothetical protein
METFIRISLIIHVITGSLALLAGLGAILLRNNVKRHRPFGKFYFWCMTIVFVTAVYISSYKSNIFLFCVAFFTYYSCITAFRSLKLKKLHIDQKPGRVDWGIEILFGLTHIGFLCFGILLLVGKSKTMGSDELNQFGIICLVFGLLGLNGNRQNIKRLRGNVEHSNYWLLAHIGGMLGSYIGAVTAFMVNNNNRFIHLPQIVAWLGPAVLLVPLIIYEVNKFKKRATLLKVK